MKTEMTRTEQNAKIEQFIEFYKQGVNSWIEAGKIIVELVEADPYVFDYIIEQCPHINAGVLGRFEQMGRGIIHPHLLLTNSPGNKALSRMPMSVQQRYLSEPIPLIVQTDAGTDVLLVKAKDLTKNQASQVFATGRVRTEGEQKAWLIEKRSMAAKPCGTNVPAWKIKNGRVEFIRDATLTAGELATIMTQLVR